jgi:hypothetical protein
MADLKFQFDPGQHYSWSQRDKVSFVGSSRLLLSAVRPSWLTDMRLYISEKNIPNKIVLPTDINITLFFDRDVDVEWNCSNSTGNCSSNSCILGIFKSSCTGFIHAYGVDIQLSVLPMADLSGGSAYYINPSAPFTFEDGHVSSTKELLISFEPKMTNHHFYDSGSSSAIGINGVQNSVMYLKPLESYNLRSDGVLDISQFAICSDHRMQANSVILRTSRESIDVPYWISRSSEKLWYGMVNNPQSGGRVYISSQMPLGTPWSACVGNSTSSINSISNLPVGNFCMINFAAMHAPCCASCSVLSNSINTFRTSSCLWSGGARLTDGVWKKNTYSDDFFYLSEKLRGSESLDSYIAFVEPGILSREFKFSSSSFMYLSRWLERFSRNGNHAFACAFPYGLREDDIPSIDSYMKSAMANTTPPIKWACYVNSKTTDACLSVLRDYVSNSHRDIYIIAIEDKTVSRAQSYGISMIVPYSVSALVHPMSGRHVVVLDVMPLEDLQ